MLTTNSYLCWVDSGFLMSYTIYFEVQNKINKALAIMGCRQCNTTLYIFIRKNLEETKLISIHTWIYFN